MFLKNSRYLNASAFEETDDGVLPFKGVRPREIGQATGVVEHTLQPGERFDWLGLHYYNDSRLWWRILDANPDVLCAAELEMNGLPGADSSEIGEVLLVPKAKE